MPLKYVKVEDDSLKNYFYAGEVDSITERRVRYGRAEVVEIGKKYKLQNFDGKRPIVVSVFNRNIVLEKGKKVGFKGVYVASRTTEYNGNAFTSLEILVDDVFSVN